MWLQPLRSASSEDGSEGSNNTRATQPLSRFSDAEHPSQQSSITAEQHRGPRTRSLHLLSCKFRLKTHLARKDSGRRRIEGLHLELLHCALDLLQLGLPTWMCQRASPLSAYPICVQKTVLLESMLFVMSQSDDPLCPPRPCFSLLPQKEGIIVKAPVSAGGQSLRWGCKQRANNALALFMQIFNVVDCSPCRKAPLS